MGMFGVFDIAGSSLGTHRVWMDAISDNVANINTIRAGDEPAFQERFVVAKSKESDTRTTPQSKRLRSSGGVDLPGGGVEATQVRYGSAEGRLVYEPNNPLADEEGYVRYPDIDLGEQMVQMTVALRGYQSNLAMVERARTAYEAAIQLGRS